MFELFHIYNQIILTFFLQLDYMDRVDFIDGRLPIIIMINVIPSLLNASTCRTIPKLSHEHIDDQK